MSDKELQEILEKHAKWLKGEHEGRRANLQYAGLQDASLQGANLQDANLQYANLQGANLQYANLRGANLQDANLQYANLQDANLQGANLRDANLQYAGLQYANLQGASLQGANLQGANLRDANLQGANLQDANLQGANLRDANLQDAGLQYANLQGANLQYARNIPFIPMACPESGSFIGFKKANGYIIKLEILSDARRSSATTRKCRCDKAKVLSITELDGTETDVTEVPSNYNNRFIYKLGEIVEEPNFCEDRFNECAEGIHFFINRQEAVEY